VQKGKWNRHVHKVKITLVRNSNGNRMEYIRKVTVSYAQRFKPVVRRPFPVLKVIIIVVIHSSLLYYHSWKNY